MTRLTPLVLGLLFLPIGATAEVCGQLAGVKGVNVEILRKQSRADEAVRFGMKVEEKKTAPVECDDVILTGADSSAKVILANAKISIGPLTRFEIASTAKATATAQPPVTLLNLTYGKLRALVNSKKDQGAGQKTSTSKGPKSADPFATFRVRTATAVAGVRGTDFYVGYDANAGVTEQATIEGAVEVSTPSANKSVLVEAGKQVTLDMAPEPALQAVPIRDSIRNDIRIVSASARDDRDFTHAKAIEVLGKPETWVLEREKLPDRLKNLKDEY